MQRRSVRTIVSSRTTTFLMAKFLMAKFLIAKFLIAMSPIAIMSPIVIVLMAFALPAHAADPAFCRTYASAALKQAQAAMTDPKCGPAAQGARWSMDVRVHYEWCLGVSLAAVGTERDARTAYLRACHS